MNNEMELRIQELVIRLIEREASNGWSRLRRVPSTSTWKIIDYIDPLPPMTRKSLFEAFASNALFLFDQKRDPQLHAAKVGHKEYCRMLDQLHGMTGWDYWSVRELRNILADKNSKSPSSISFGVPSSVLQRAQSLQPTNAAAIRKVVKKVLTERFAGKAEKLDGSDWRYMGSHQGRNFTLWLDYGGRDDQLRYELDYQAHNINLSANRLNYERLLGFGFGHWNFITADNLQACILLLSEFIEELLTIPEQLDKL